MDERIKEHLKLLNRYCLLLLETRKLSLDDLKKDDIRQGSTERYLHLAIESCINIGNRMLSLYQFKKPIRTPETYADIFTELCVLGVIDSGFSEKLKDMAKFRNRLVHLYWELDIETTYQILQNDLEDFKKFQDAIVDYMKNNPLTEKPGKP